MHEFIFLSLYMSKESENIPYVTIVTFSISNWLCLEVLIAIHRSSLCYELWWKQTAEMH